MLTPACSHPAFLWAGAGLALLTLGLGLWSQRFPGYGVQVVGQRPWLQGLGLALLLAGAGLGLAEPRWGTPEVPRLTVHVVLDASRSMLVPDAQGGTRWRAALALLDRLWARPNPGIRFSLDLLTGDAVPVLPPGEDQLLLRDALRAVDAGDVGSPGTSMGRGLCQVAALVEPRSPAIILLIGDGEETVEPPAQALARSGAFLRQAHLPLYACALGSPQSQPVPTPAAPGDREFFSTAQPGFLKTLAEASGGQLLAAGEDPGPLFQRLAQGTEPMPLARSLLPAHPEWGAWLALAGLCLWLAAAGRPMRAWRPFLLLALAFLAAPVRARLPQDQDALATRSQGPGAMDTLTPGSWTALPESFRAWKAQSALEAGDLETARRWRPAGANPLHLLLAAEIQWRSGQFQSALTTLTPLTGQGSRRPVPVWRGPALLLAARASLDLNNPAQARSLLERLLLEQPGRPEAVHNLQALLQDPSPPKPAPRQPPPPPPPKPSQGARQDELDGLRQRLPRKTPPSGGVKDI